MKRYFTLCGYSNRPISRSTRHFLNTFLALLLGLATITSCKKDKVAPNVNVDSVVFESTTKILAEGDIEVLKATVLPENANNKTITWSSSDDKIAKVDQGGKVTALQSGEVTITVTTADGAKTATCMLSIKEVLTMETVSVQAGTFKMGVKFPSAEGGRQTDEVQHEVRLTKGFKMSKTEITNKQFCAFLNTNKIGADGQFKSNVMVKSSATADDGKFNWGVNWNGTKWVPVEGKADFPVIYVTWSGASEFAKWAGGDLPTEAQWEYACRSGLEDKPFGFATGLVLKKENANYDWTTYYENGTIQFYLAGSSAPSTGTIKVGTFAPSSNGLVDMHGNVGEWCKDWYGALTVEAVNDPIGATTGTYRVVRGGSWKSYSIVCRSGFRNTPLTAVSHAPKPDESNNCTGFRVVMPL